MAGTRAQAGDHLIEHAERLPHFVRLVAEVIVRPLDQSQRVEQQERDRAGGDVSHQLEALPAVVGNTVYIAGSVAGGFVDDAP